MASISEREENAYTLGVQAGLWGYPLAHRVEAFPAALEAKGIGHNSFRKFDRLKTAEDRFVVTPNNLTIDAYAILDVADGPVVLHVPKLGSGRWFIVQIGDAFDDVVLNIGGSRAAGARRLPDHRPDYQGRVPGDMIQVPFARPSASRPSASRSTGVDDLAGAVEAPGRLHACDRCRTIWRTASREPTSTTAPLRSPNSPHRRTWCHFDRLGSAMRYMLPAHADVNDTFVQTLGTIGLSVRKGFDWQVVGRVDAGRSAACGTGDRADHRRALAHDERNGQRMARLAGIRAVQLRLGTQRRQHQVPGRHRTRRPSRLRQHHRRRRESTAERRQQLRPALRTGPDTAGGGHVEHRDVRRLDAVRCQRYRPLLHRQHHRRPHPERRRLPDHLPATHQAPRRSVEQLVARPAGSFNLTMRYYTPLAPVLDKTYRLPPVQKWRAGSGR